MLNDVSWQINGRTEMDFVLTLTCLWLSVIQSLVKFVESELYQLVDMGGDPSQLKLFLVLHSFAAVAGKAGDGQLHVSHLQGINCWIEVHFCLLHLPLLLHKPGTEEISL